MRELTTHKVNGVNDELTITAMDEPGHGGACHEYKIEVGGRNYFATEITFQNGPIKEVGTNGLTHEALLAVVMDRLQGFQKGQYACRENALALTKIEEAMHWLQQRTHERLKRGVEGTHEK